MHPLSKSLFRWISKSSSPVQTKWIKGARVSRRWLSSNKTGFYTHEFQDFGIQEQKIYHQELSKESEALLKGRDLWVLNQMMSISASEGDMEATFDIYKKILENKISPDTSTFNYLLMSCSNASGNHVEDAMHTLREMKKRNVKPTLHSFNLALKTCANMNDLKTIMEILGDMRKDSIEPDMTTYSFVLQSMTNYDSDTILKFWKDFKEVYQPNLTSYYAVIKALNGHMTEIKGIYKEMLAKQITPDEKVVAILLRRSLEYKTLDFSKHLFDKCINEWATLISFNRDIYHDLIKVAAKCSPPHVYLAVDFIKKNKFPFDTRTYELVCMAYGRFGETKHVLRYVELARARDSLSLGCFYGILLCCRANRDPDRAWLCFKTVVNSRFTPDTHFIHLLELIFKENRREDLMTRLKEEWFDSSKDLDE